MSKEKFKKIAEETLNAINVGNFTTQSGKSVKINLRSLNDSILFKPNWGCDFKETNINKNPNISVTQESTLSAAKRLFDEGKNPCVLNFASGTNPGGGFKRGTASQEESIARSSTLYPTLIIHPEFYLENKKEAGVYKNYAIYSRDVMVIKDYNGNWLEDPYNVSVLTSAAPNMNLIRKLTSQTVNPEVEEAFYDRIDQVLKIMHHCDHKNIVLGAWGCGAFGNDPWLVSDFFLDLLESNPYFDEIVFAIYDKKESDTFKAFEEAFVK